MAMMRRNESNLRLPDFLVIGAMKAGTTSLAADLQAVPGVFFPSVKEPHFLTDETVLKSSGRRRYAQLFARSKDDQRCGEASTGYTKLPSIQNVPRRAKRLLGSDVRLVYLVRNPIDRALSHHYHLRRSRDLSIDMDEAVRHVPELVDYGRYAMQLEPWLDEFDAGSFHIVRFEDYTSDRREVVAGICRFLDVEPLTHRIDVESVHNDGQSAPSPNPLVKSLLRGVTRSQWYKVHVHPRTPQRLRDALKPVVMRKPPARPAPPLAETLKYLADCFRDDAERLRVIVNRQEPLWDLDAHRDDEPLRAAQSEHGGIECNSSAR
jgi:hypothetical protein